MTTPTIVHPLISSPSSSTMIRGRRANLTAEVDNQTSKAFVSAALETEKKLSRPRWRFNFRRLVGVCILATLVVVSLFRFGSADGRIIRQQIWEHRWNRIVWRFFQTPSPRGILSGSVSTRRQVLEYESKRPSLSRETSLVDRHLGLLENDMSERSNSKSTLNKTVVLLWSGSYPVWNAKVKMGIDETCNVPCEWTTDRSYNKLNKRDKVSGLVCLLYGLEHGQCRDFNVSFLHLPILGVSWESDWRHAVPGLDELPSSQIWNLKRQSPYNLISSYELDSHIPIMYPDLADLVDHFKIESFDHLVQQRQDQLASVMFTISNCVAPIRPDRLGLIQSLSEYFPTSSFGLCLGEEINYAKSWNSRSKYGSKLHLQEIGKYMFVYAPENSYGIDYVTEKVYHPLISGAVPIYIGAPNIAAFLPDRDAAIHVSDFSSVEELGLYLQTLSKNVTMLVERHHAWRTRPLPPRLLRMVKLVDRKSEHSFMCKVCNCFRGGIGCSL